MGDQVRHVGLELALDLPDELEPLGAVELLRLRLDEAIDALVAVVGVVARRAALVFLEEVRVRVVDDACGEVGADLEPARGEKDTPRSVPRRVAV